MADLDADLQGPGGASFSDEEPGIHGDFDAVLTTGVGGIFHSPEWVEDHIHWTGALQFPKSGAFSAARSYCTCESGSPNMHTEGITAFADHLDVQFSDDVVLSGPALEEANWYVTNPGPALGREVTVTNITIVGSIVRLGVTPQTLNANYTLHLPLVGITSPGFATFVGLYSLDFLGVPTVVGIQMVKTIDARTVDVIFGVAVNEADASDPLNYSVNNGLTVTAARRITDFWYRLTTTRQTNDVIYTFIASNIGPL